MLNHRTIIVGLVAVSVLGVVGYGMARLTPSSGDNQARHIVDTCVQEGADRSACYERIVPELLSKVPLPEVFGIIREIRTLDPAYQFCHVLAHKLGERIVANDPNKWIDAIPLNPADGLCSNGFIHGVVGGRFRAEVLDEATIKHLLPEFSRACEPRDDWSPSDLDKAICYHGLGHLYDFITDADIPKALWVCNETTPESMRRVCVEGVFMQIYQPLEPDDFLMLERMDEKPSPSTVRTYCTQFPVDAHEGACLRESWPYAREAILSGSGAQDFCSGQPNADETRKCFESISSIVGRMSLDDIDQAVTACSGFPGAFQDTCFAASAQAVLEENRSDGQDAIELCDRAPGSAAERCKLELANRAAFIYGSDAKRRSDFCALLPKGIRTKCSAL